MEGLNKQFPRHSKHWLPIVWAASIVTRARREGRIRDDFAVKTILDELNKFRGQCGLLLSYDTISVPLVYTQVVTLAVYSFFITAIVGRQWVDEKDVTHSAHPRHRHSIDLYFPIFTTLQVRNCACMIIYNEKNRNILKHDISVIMSRLIYYLLLFAVLFLHGVVESG